MVSDYLSTDQQNNNNLHFVPSRFLQFCRSHMDFNNRVPWKWHREKSSNHDMAPFSLNGVTKNTEHMSCLCDEATPIKDCGDFDYSDKESGEIYSQAKRRRILFTTSAIARSLCRKEISSPFIKSKELECSVEADLPESSYTDDVASPIDDSTDQYSEEWLADCLDEVTINSSLDHMNLSSIYDVQNDVSELCNVPPQCEAKLIQECSIKTPPKIVIKGIKSDIPRETDLTSSVAYPFVFLKPCEVLGGVTLDDINQRIHAPTPSTSNMRINQENRYDLYPTSAFSGKPVVLKTKIHTEGRKGSVTIMRTKG